MLSRTGRSPHNIDLGTATEEDISRLLMGGHKIDAIEVYRRLHGVDLKAANEAVERLAAKLPGAPRADRAIPFLDRILQISSPIILLAAVFGWIQPRLPLALGSGAYVGAVLLGFAVAVVTVQRTLLRGSQFSSCFCDFRGTGLCTWRWRSCKSLARAWPFACC